MKQDAGHSTKIQFALPAPELRHLVTTYYFTQVTLPEEEDWLEDYLHPEWANIRFLEPGISQSAIGQDELQHTPEFSVTGPTSRSTRFRLASGRSWGIGLMPLGWATLIGAPAQDYADRFVDGHADEAFTNFADLARALAMPGRDFKAELALIEAHMAQFIGKSIRHSGAIQKVNAALINSDIANVADLAEASGLKVRSLERLSQKAFGFSPKLLLRRQRFLRSLAQFMLDPSLKWLNAIDCQYHDQAHFVRDFQRFMGMSPTAYAKLDHPFLMAAAKARAEIAGEAVQGLHDPTLG